VLDVFIICIDSLLADGGGGGFLVVGAVTRQVCSVIGSKTGTIGHGLSNQMFSVCGTEEMLAMLEETMSNRPEKTVPVAVHVVFAYSTDGCKGGVTDVGVGYLALNYAGQDSSGWYKESARYVRVGRICIVYDKIVNKEVARVASG
jgi:hypothetical protein